MEDKPITVRSKHKGYIKQSGIIQSLLHPFTDGVLIGFGFDNRQWQVRLVIQYDIGRFHFDT